MEGYEKIHSEVIENNGVKRITIDFKIAEYLGIKKRDKIVGWIKKDNTDTEEKTDEED